MAKTSAPVSVMTQLYKDSFVDGSKNYDCLNHSLREALFMCVRLRMEFNPHDMAEINTACAMHRWIGDGGEEALYATSIAYGNASAQAAIEHWLTRTPMHVDWGCMLADKSCRAFAGYCRERKGQTPVHVGMRFDWPRDGKTYNVVVTSINDEADKVTACWHVGDLRYDSCPECGGPRWDIRPSRKVGKRFTITRAQLEAYSKEQAAARKAAKPKPQGTQAVTLDINGEYYTIRPTDGWLEDQRNGRYVGSMVNGYRSAGEVAAKRAAKAICKERGWKIVKAEVSDG